MASAQLWFILGIFLISETVFEDAGALRKLDVIVTVETVIALVVTLFGLSLLGGLTQLTVYLNPYKVYVLGVGMIFGFLEVRTKI